MSNQVGLTIAKLNAPSDLKGMFEIEEFRVNFIRNHALTTSVPDSRAAMVWEREKILFMKAVEANKALAECDRFSLYSAFIELAVSGVSLDDGEGYIIPYGKKAQFQIGWKGRRNQMVSSPGVESVGVPMMVYDCDEFDVEYGEEPRIIRHKPTIPRPEGSKKIAVYMVIHMEPTTSVKNMRKIILMTADEVYSIRDTYSKPYRQYVEACKAHGKKIGDTIRIPMEYQGRKYDKTIEPPMWITSEDEAWKKTCVKRGSKSVSRNKRLKALDAKIANNFDPEDGTGGDEPIDYGIVNEDGTTTNVPKPEAQKTATKTRVKADTAKQPESDKATVTPQDLSNIESGDPWEGTGAIQDAQIVDDGNASPLTGF